MKFIDANAHVEESEEMWRLLDLTFASRLPIPVRLRGDTSLTDGKVFPEMNGRVYFTFGTPPISKMA